MSESSQATILPARFQDADVDHLVVLIADMLQRLITHNDKIPLSPESLTRFHSRSPPAISVLEYLRRIAKYTNVEKTCLLITLHYIDQICARVPRFTISSLTVHRFIISSITVSSKALCDVFCANSFYAKVGGLQLLELNVLEKVLLDIIDWRLTCSSELLQEYYVNLVRTHSAGRYKIEEVPPPTPTIMSLGNELSRSRPTSPVAAAAHTPLLPPPPSPASPGDAQQRVMGDGGGTGTPPLVIAEPSGVLMGRPMSPSTRPVGQGQTGPTALEQNMAFAALQAETLAPFVEEPMPPLRPEKRTSGDIIDQTDVDNIRPVKRKLRT